eukprot:10860935-Alexandrium_andersonii.AAC.1
MTLRGFEGRVPYSTKPIALPHPGQNDLARAPGWKGDGGVGKSSPWPFHLCHCLKLCCCRTHG